MKDIIKKLDLIDSETANLNDMQLLLCKSKSIVEWLEDSDSIETKTIFNILYNVIERYVIVGKHYDDDKQIFNIIYPIVCYIEEYYNANAEKYEPEKTSEQLKMECLGGNIFSSLLQIQTMKQYGWNFRCKENTIMFDETSKILENYLNLINQDIILSNTISEKLEQLNKYVILEFNKFMDYYTKLQSTTN